MKSSFLYECKDAIQQGTRHKLIIGNSASMPEIPDRSVQLVVTSPPYFNAKFHPPFQFATYEDYLVLLRRAAAELHRVLADGRIAAMVVDDVRLDGTLYPVVADATKIMIDAGFRYRDRIVWEKPEGFVRISRRSGVLLQHPYPLYGYFDNLTETILLFQRGELDLKTFMETVPSYAKEKSRIDLRWWQEEKWSQAVWNITNVLPKRGRLEEGVCAFPAEIPKRLISLFSFVGETVLDPFCGSGTTMQLARQLGRHSVGIEIQPQLEQVIRQKTGFAKPTNQDVFEVIRRFSLMGSSEGNVGGAWGRGEAASQSRRCHLCSARANEWGTEAGHFYSAAEEAVRGLRCRMSIKVGRALSFMFRRSLRLRFESAIFSNMQYFDAFLH